MTYPGSGHYVRLIFLGDYANARKAIREIRSNITGLVTQMRNVAMMGPVMGAAMIASIPIAFGALAFKALIETEKVRKAFDDMVLEITMGVQELAQGPYEQMLIDKFEEIEQTFTRIAPHLLEIFQRTAPMVDILSTAVLRFVEHAMTGFLQVVRVADPVIVEMAIGIEKLGKGFRDMWINISEGVPGATIATRDFLSLVSQLLPHTGELVAILTNGFAPIIAQITPAILHAADGMKLMTERIVSAAGPIGVILSQWITWWGNLLPIIGQLVAALATGLAPIMQAVVPLMTLIAQTIANLLSPALEALGPPIAAVVDGLTMALRPAFEALEQVWRMLMPVLIQIVDGIAVLLVGALKILTPILPPLILAFGEIVKVVLEFIPPILELAQMLLPALSQILHAVLEGILLLVPPIVELGQQLFPLLADIIGQLAATLIQMLVPVIVEIARTLFPLLAQVIRELTPIILMIADDVLPALVNIFLEVLKVGLQIIRDLLPVLAQLLRELIPVIFDLASNLLPLFVEILHLVADVFAELGPVVLDLVRAVLPLLVDLIREVVIPVIKDLLIPAIKTLAEVVFPALAAVIQDVVVPIIKLVVDKIVDFINWCRTLTPVLEGLVSLLTGSVSAAFRTISQLLADMMNGLTEQLRAVQDFFRRLPQEGIIGPLGDLSKTLFQSGITLMTGFMDGILSQTVPLYDALKRTLEPARALFPSSPPKDGPFAGENYTLYTGAKLMRDFAAGAESIDLKAIFSKILSGIGGMFSPSPGGGGTASASIPGVGAIEVRVAPGADSALASLLMNMVRTGQLQLMKAG